MDALDIRIRRLVWHGTGRPDAAALAEAIGSALARASSAAGAAPSQVSPIAACATAIAREIAPRLKPATELDRG